MPWKSQRSKWINIVRAGIPHSQTPPTRGKSIYPAMGEKEGKEWGGGGGGGRSPDMDYEIFQKF